MIRNKKNMKNEQDIYCVCGFVFKKYKLIKTIKYKFKCKNCGKWYNLKKEKLCLCGCNTICIDELSMIKGHSCEAL